MIRSAVFILFVLGAAVVPSVPHADIAGRATVIDGDTIEVHGQRIRLHGIDAPEAAQLCQAKGKSWRCGQQASLALDAEIAGRPVSCMQKDIDRYRRIVAVCFAGGVDLNAWMVAEGWALAYRQYSTDYVRQENHASASKLGIWQGAFVAPWDWRRGKRLEVAMTQRSDSCLIKGNISISSGERIYHVPGGYYYDRTQIDGSKGERWFCSEVEARAAGCDARNGSGQGAVRPRKALVELPTDLRASCFVGSWYAWQPLAPATSVESGVQWFPLGVSTNDR